MAMTARQLIIKAYYLSGLVGRQLQTVSCDEIADGLELLNSLLAIKTADNRLIPYYGDYDLTLVAGQEKYFIPNLIEVETVTFDLYTVRFPTRNMGRREYFGSPRVNNLSSLPFSVHAERAKGGTNLYFYFLPQSGYASKVWGKFSLNDVTLAQDLSLTMERFYIEYLRYALAEYICNDYNISFPPNAAGRLAEYEKFITDISPLDMNIGKMSTLTKEFGFDWAMVNLGRGWTPG